VKALKIVCGWYDSQPFLPNLGSEFNVQ